MSRRIVIASWGSYGDVYPYVGLARALKARGHRPIVTTAAYFRDIVERESLDFAPVGPDVDYDRQLFARLMDPVKGPETVVRDIVIPAVRRSYEELAAAADGADLLIGHPLTFAVPLLARGRGLPWVSTLLAPIGFFSATDFPVLPSAPWLVHLSRAGPWFARGFVRLARRMTNSWMEPIDRLNADLGLRPGGHPLFEGQFSPLLTLALFSRVLADQQPDWPPHVAVTGFVLYNNPDPLDAALAAFLDAGPPPIVFTLGTSAVGAAGRFYHESVAAVAELGARAVLLTGGFAENQPTGPLPPGVLLVDGAPHQHLFPRAAAIVHQGGIGTTAEALRSGRPMLVVPHSHDQPDNAFRVTRLGVARTLFPTRYKSARVARELDQLMRDATCRDRSASIAQVVKKERGAEAAADAIEALRI